MPVASSRSDSSKFGPERESDLNHTIRNTGGTPNVPMPPRTDLPPMVRDVPQMPPVGFPKFDPAKPETDFQLQQALAVVRAMQVGKRASR